MNSAIIAVEEQTTDTRTDTVTGTKGWGLSIAGASFDSSRGVGEKHLFVLTIGLATTYQGVVGDLLERDVKPSRCDRDRCLSPR